MGTVIVDHQAFWSIPVIGHEPQDIAAGKAKEKMSMNSIPR